MHDDRERTIPELEGTLDATTPRATTPPRASFGTTGFDRYELRELVGEGAQGEVRSAYDRVLRREVALKILRKDAATADEASRFVAEAQLTAQLAHPHIIPVYDAGISPDGRPYYSMPLLPRRSFADVLAARREPSGDPRPEHSLARMLRLFSAACEAVAAAHAHGVIHRDLKPSNLVLDPHDQILVADFGLAHLASAPGISTDRKENGLAGSVIGNPIGTPLYMPPEQARGARDEIGPWSDTYALGAILYEILAHRAPIVRSSVVEQLVAIMTLMPERPETVADASRGEVPLELADLAMRCLEKRPEARPASVRELVESIDGWFERKREHARRAEEATRLLEEARARLGEADRQWSLLGDARLAVQQRRRDVPAYASVDEKAPLWEAEDRANAVEAEAERAEDDAVIVLEAALHADAQHHDARTLLAEIHLRRLERRRSLGDRIGEDRQRRRAIRAGGDAMRDRIDSPGTLVLHVRPATAELELERFVERGRRLVPELVRRGRADALAGPLDAGSYRLVARLPLGLRYAPFVVRPRARANVLINLALGEGLLRDFAILGGGRATIGGDPNDLAATPAREVELAAFALAVRPVSCAEYLDFLRALEIDEALTRAPRAPGGGAPYWTALDGRVSIPPVDAQGDHWGPTLPVFSISALDAEAYARWRGERDGRKYRLPTADEWEVAARGADLRIYPWGNHFDPAFCLMRDSRAGRVSPGPIGTCATDVSPFGVIDLAGGVADWTCTPYRGQPGHRTVKGGGWSTRAHRCAATYGGGYQESETSGDLGFRVALDL